MMCILVNVGIYDVFFKIESIILSLQNLAMLSSLSILILVFGILTSFLKLFLRVSLLDSNKLIINLVITFLLHGAVDIAWLDTEHERNANEHNKHKSVHKLYLVVI